MSNHLNLYYLWVRAKKAPIRPIKKPKANLPNPAKMSPPMTGSLLLPPCNSILRYISLHLVFCISRKDLQLVASDKWVFWETEIEGWQVRDQAPRVAWLLAFYWQIYFLLWQRLYWRNFILYLFALLHLNETERRNAECASSQQVLGCDQGIWENFLNRG